MKKVYLQLLLLFSFVSLVVASDLTGQIDGHNYVDLGLSSGKYWSTVNYGANLPEGGGEYVDFPRSDIVSYHWGSNWRIPTKDEYQELINECEWSWTSMNGVNGYIIKGKNGNTVFLPAAGLRTDAFGISNKSSLHYWTMTKVETDRFTPTNYLYMLFASESEIKLITEWDVGIETYPIRPISNIKGETKEKEYTIGISSSGNGSVICDGTTVRNKASNFEVKEGTNVTISFSPDNGFQIKSVKLNSTDVTSSVFNNSYIISSINANTTVEVEFEAIPITTYTLSLMATGNGYVTYDGTSVRNETKTFTLNEGTSATITFTPDNGSRIVSVKVNNIDVTSSVVNNQYTVSNISGNTTVKVEFETIPPTTYTLSLTVSGNGSVFYNETIAITGSKYILSEGSNATFTFVPDNGYQVKSVKVNGSDVTADVINNQYTISNIMANTTMDVEFDLIPYVIITYSLSVKAEGSGAAIYYDGTTIRNDTKTFTLNEGASVRISFDSDDGYRIKSVKVNNSDVTANVTNNAYVISNISANTTVEVEFEAIPVNTFILKYVVDGETYKTYELKEGEAIMLEAEPTKEGYTFSGWSEIPATMPAEDVTITGTFTKNELEIKTYKLTINVRGNGFISYNGTSFRNQSSLLHVYEGSDVVISFFPDDGYRIISVKVNSYDVTSNIANNTYSISNINDDTIVEVEFEQPDTIVVDGIYYWVGEDNTVSVKSGEVRYSGDVVIPESVEYGGKTYRVTSIDKRAFDRCYGLTSVYIPNSVTTIASSAFIGCSGLTSVDVPNSVTTIGESAFAVCENLTSVYIGNGVMSIGEEAFYSCSNLSSVIIPNSVTSIGSRAFDRCSRLSNVISEIETPFEISTKVFSGISSEAILTVPKGTKAAYQATVGWNQFTNIVEAGDVEPDQPGQIHINDIFYKLTGSGEAEVVSVEEGETSVTIPSTISYNNNTYKVTSIAKEVFENREHLAAVIWEPEAQFNAKVNNPNFLLYVSDEKYASHTVKNVVVNGVAENIELTDAANGNDFYCPKAFKAKSIIYSHNYQMETGLGDSRGWETIVLPFDVQKYTHATKGELESFTTWSKGSSKKPFWLFELTTSGYKDVAGIKANIPYIISLPNNQQYEQQYQIPGIVTFSASDVEVQKSDNLKPVSYQGRTFVPNYTNQNNADFLALNVSNNYVTNPGRDISGSKFVRGLRAVHPFEAYMTTTDNTRSIDVMDGMPTSIKGVRMDSDEKSSMKVYDIRGRQMSVSAESLKPGIYIVNGKKMIIKK